MKMQNNFQIADPLLVSCPGEGGLVYLINNDLIVLSKKSITGLYADSQQLVWAYQGEGGRKIRRVLNGLSEEFEISPEQLDLHDVLIIDSKIYVVITERNEVVCLDHNFAFVNKWGLPGESDSAHINSIAYYQGRILASVFGLFEKHREYKEGTLGLGKVLDIRTGEIIIEGLSQPHSLTVHGNLLYLCSSEDKELIAFDGRAIVKRLPLPGYTRGITIGKNHIYVGLSLSRNIPDAQHEHNNAKIAVIDKQSISLIGTCNIPFREIYDIRILDNSFNLLAAIGSVLSECEEEISNYRAEVAILQQQLKNMENSRSWRIAAPLRFINKLFRL